MEEEPIALSTRDRDRLKVLSKAKKGLITQKQAAQHLDVTDLQIRRRVTRMREQGDRSILHGLRGQASNRRIPEAAKQQALSLLATKEYADFGPTLASEYLGKKRGLWIGKETVRKWMTEAGSGECIRPRSRKCISGLTGSTQSDWFRYPWDIYLQIFRRASQRLRNQLVFRHSSRRRRLKLSANAF